MSIRLVKDTPLYSEKPITTSQDAVELVGKMMGELDREMICIINLNTKGKPINMNVVSVGGISSAYCEPANVFKSAILCNAAYIIVLHNHPSGDTTPSREDIALTNRLIKSGKSHGYRNMKTANFIFPTAIIKLDSRPDDYTGILRVGNNYYSIDGGRRLISVDNHNKIQTQDFYLLTAPPFL